MQDAANPSATGARASGPGLLNAEELTAANGCLERARVLASNATMIYTNAMLQLWETVANCYELESTEHDVRLQKSHS